MALRTTSLCSIPRAYGGAPRSVAGPRLFMARSRRGQGAGARSGAVLASPARGGSGQNPDATPGSDLPSSGVGRVRPGACCR
ncbi:hypothetical protein CU044_2922 [Streptomyces sp. L-9-10]|nr:hypothetical protein CU044_2922 [Streptomyces sp. L-9-10]